MRYPASEKLEIIRLVEQSHLSVRRTLAQIGVLPIDSAANLAEFIEAPQAAKLLKSDAIVLDEL